MIQRVVHNFYLRNFFAMLIYVSPTLLQDIANVNHGGVAHVIKNACGHIAFFTFFVFHSRILYEQLFARKRYFLYAVTFMVTIFTWRESSSYFIWLLTKSPAETVYHIEELQRFNWVFWVFIYWADFVYSWIALGVYLAFKYFNERARLLEIGNIQKEMELKRLNEQLNPHFLFNALNNIYSHLMHESGNGKELILKLSELMRYVLDTSKKETVPLIRELGFIEHYIAFEKERLGRRCQVHYSKNISAISFNVAPLILFTFIENTFKHGTMSIQSSDIFIDIHADEQSLLLMVSNPVFALAKHSTKTGLDNVKKRLSLLYADAYNLDIQRDDNTYTVKLKIQNIR